MKEDKKDETAAANVIIALISGAIGVGIAIYLLM